MTDGGAAYKKALAKREADKASGYTFFQSQLRKLKAAGGTLTKLSASIDQKRLNLAAAATFMSRKFESAVADTNAFFTMPQGRVAAQ